MSLRLVIIADTHVPKRARALPDPVWTAVDAWETRTSGPLRGRRLVEDVATP